MRSLPTNDIVVWLAIIFILTGIPHIYKNVIHNTISDKSAFDALLFMQAVTEF